MDLFYFSNCSGSFLTWVIYVCDLVETLPKSVG
jgi:hypothetical protein